MNMPAKYSLPATAFSNNFYRILFSPITANLSINFVLIIILVSSKLKNLPLTMPQFHFFKLENSKLTKLKLLDKRKTLNYILKMAS